MIALDFGTGGKLQLNNGKPVRVPSDNPTKKYPRLYSQWQTRFGDRPPAHRKFARNLEILLAEDDVVTESATIGASGAEAELIRDVVANAPHKLYTIPPKAVKNYAAYHNVKRDKMGGIPDDKAAAIIWTLSQTNPDCMRVWKYTEKKERLKRIHTSVRPYDKREYMDPDVTAWMAQLPPINTLPEYAQWLWGDGKANLGYSPSFTLPFMMAFDEPASVTRSGYEKITGLYGHGYPSFYRRATVVVMQKVAKGLYRDCYGDKMGSGKNGLVKNEDISQAMRKRAWRTARTEIRRLYHLTKGTQASKKDTFLP